MHRQFNIKQFHVLPTQCVYVFHVDLKTSSYYFPPTALAEWFL